MKILVIGLNPSKRHGESPSLKRLYSWLDILEVKTVSFTNLYEDYEINKDRMIDVAELSKDYKKVIALGTNVSDTLCHMGINHFRLPHPSGLNRQLNDTNYVNDLLQSCKLYLRS